MWCLRINLTKSKIILVNKIDNVEGLAYELGYRVGSLSASYLGLPLGAPHTSVGV